MSEKEIASDSELYKNLVEILSSGNFLQLNGKAINLTELNDYVNTQNQEIERLTKQNKALNEMYELTKKEYIKLHSIIKEVREYIENTHYYSEVINEEYLLKEELLKILDKEKQCTNCGQENEQ